MLLSNFTLVEPLPTITLASDGLEWDLHAFAEFQGLRLGGAAGCLVMRWSISPKAVNPWGSERITAAGCELAFRAVRSLQVVSSGAVPHAEDTALADINWADAMEPALVFSFMSGRTIQISAESAELRSIAGSVA